MAISVNVLGVAGTALVAACGASAADASVVFSENFANSIGGNYSEPAVIPNSQFYVSAGNIDLIGTPSGSPFSCVDNPGGNCVNLVGAFANGGIASTPTFSLVKGDSYTVSFGSNLQGFSTTDNAVTMFQVGLGNLSQTETLTAADGDKAFSITAANLSLLNCRA